MADPAGTLPRDLRDTDTYRQVSAQLTAWRGPSLGQVTDVTDIDARPGGGAVAVTAWRRFQVTTPPVPAVAIIDTRTGTVRLLTDDTGSAPGSSRRTPRWSPDGTLLLCLERGNDGQETAVVVDPTDDDGALVQIGGDGTVEWAAWSPDGTRIALLVAEPGAEISDVFGSGRVAGRAGLPSWAPEVAAEGRSGWRRLWVCDADGSRLRAVPSPLNSWEVAWAGPYHLLTVASHQPDEDAWYSAELMLVDTSDGSHRCLVSPAHQIALPASNADGTHVSAVVGTASDRGLLAGDVVLVDTATGAVTPADTGSVHVTSQTWSGSTRLLLAGLRGRTTVLGEFDVALGRYGDLWQTTETFGPGDLLPVAVPDGRGGAALVLESHGRPPTLGLVTGGTFHALLDCTHPGTSAPAAVCADHRPIRWCSEDGLAIDGHVVTPPGIPGPHPLVVMIHGGPVWQWRDTWAERVLLVPLLVSRGYAVLLPNPRGSQGRGEAFVRGIVREVGGRDVDDVLTGIDHLVAQGIADPERLAVTGSSYGGFLAAWLATVPGRFAAAFASSPVTDWVSQHFTTNIPQSDVRFLVGDPRDPRSQYRTRSPLLAASAATAPLLLTAGAHDLATPPGQAVAMHRALAELGVATDIAIYPDEGHDVHDGPALVDHCTRLLLWFDRYLGRRH